MVNPLSQLLAWLTKPAPEPKTTFELIHYPRSGYWLVVKVRGDSRRYLVKQANGYVSSWHNRDTAKICRTNQEAVELVNLYKEQHFEEGVSKTYMV